MSYSGKFKDKNNNLHPVTSVLYGTCDTAAATAAKVVTCTDFDTLMTGVTIRVKFANANTAASPTVNINSTGAKSIYRFGSTAPVDGSSWNAGEVVELVYDGTSFFMTGADDIAAKQNATDNSLETEAKTIVGAINEHEGDVSTLKSGLTNLDNEVNGDAVTYPYADVITIEDAVPSNLADCSVKIEPVQDLHGYDKPWVGGAGKNICPPFSTQTSSDVTLTWDATTGTAVLNGTNNTASSINFTIPCDSTVAETEYWLNGAPSDASDNTYYMYVQTKNYGTQKSDYGSGVSFNYNSNGCRVFIRLVAGATANNVVFRPMVCLNSETDKTFAPYTNICPITGHTEASVQRVGRNLLPTLSAQTTVNGITYTPNSDGSITLNGTATNFSNIDLGRGALTLPAGQYTSSAKKNGIGNVLFVTYKNTSPAQTITSVGSFTLTETTDIFFRIGVESGTILTNVTVYPQIEAGDTATPYVPHEQTYAIALGDTIYGGTVDFDSGVMTVTHAVVDMGTLTWGEQGNPNTYQAQISDMLTPTNDLLCSEYAAVDYSATAANMPDKSIKSYGNSSGKFLILKDSSYADATEVTTAMDGVQLYYPLVTPTTIQLNPQQIQLLKGTNTLTASTGQISVTVNGVSGSIGAVQKQANDTDAALAELADKLPTAPTTDGEYVLTVTVADGTPTYSWESAE